MARRVFVDTSGWYALLDRNDALHGKAVAQLSQMLRSRAPLVTSDYVVDETLTLTKARAGSFAAQKLLDLLQQTRLLEWEWIGTERFARAETLFRKRSDQDWSFTDCTSFTLMKELRIESAITSDAHFQGAGYNALLAAPRRGTKGKGR
jgi:predicted nucleic acid-binding protein